MIPSNSSSSKQIPRMTTNITYQPSDMVSNPSPSKQSPSSPNRLILNSPPLDHTYHHHDYFQSNIKGPKPLHPPGQGQNVKRNDPPSPTSNIASSSTTNRKYSLPLTMVGISKGRTPAEVYANEHTKQQSNQFHQHQNRPKNSNIIQGSELNLNSKRNINENSQQQQQQQQQPQKEKSSTKPIFDWISRKLGSRRATISESPFINSHPNLNNNNNNNGGSPKLQNGRNRLPSMPKPSTSTRGGFKNTPNRGSTTGKGLIGGRYNDNGVNRSGHGMKREPSQISENQSISMMSISTRSYVGTVERERRREANNPYPSIPIPKLMAASGIRDTIRKERGRQRANHNGRNGIDDPGTQIDDDGQTNTTFSMSLSYSYLSRSPRSRSYSLDSIRSSQISHTRTRSLDDLDLNNNNNNDRDELLSENGLRLISSGPGATRSKHKSNKKKNKKFRNRASTSGTNDRPPSSLLGLRGNSILGGISLIGGIEADDDASLRPFPPSHPASPTPSTSVLSRTGSNPIPPLNNTTSKLDGQQNGGGGGRSRTNTFYSTWSGAGYNKSLTSSSLDGLYGSTYRYSYDRRGERDGEDDNDDEEEEEDDDNDDDDGEDGDRSRQSRQDSTSTKPTTCISFDSTPAIAHIAQPNIQDTPQPPHIQIQTQTQIPFTTISQTHTPVIPQNGSFALAGVVTSSPNSVDHSHSNHMDTSLNQIPSSSLGGMERSTSLPSSPTPQDSQQQPASSSSPIPPTPTTPTSSTTPSSPTRPIAHVQAPKHTPHHPLFNPIPNEIPDDNASMLTLASSTFGLLPNQNTGQSGVLAQGQGQGQNGYEVNQSNIPRQIPLMTQPILSDLQDNNESDPNTPQLPASQTIQNQNKIDKDKIPNEPPSIHRLKDSTSIQPLRPSSILTSPPSIHWAPVPTPLEERPISNYSYNYNYNYPPSINHAASIMSYNNGNKGWTDRDASVRAIRRKGSWESYESGWSWRGNNLNSDGWGNTNTNKRDLASPIGLEDGKDKDKAASFKGSYKGSNKSGGGYKAESWKSRNEDNELERDERVVIGSGGGSERVNGIAVVAAN